MRFNPLVYTGLVALLIINSLVATHTITQDTQFIPLLLIILIVTPRNFARLWYISKEKFRL